ncbi:MAG: GNAT family N-acetyltransferase [Rhodobiaceae bacterium]|nr:MAG: GNAT family N-acetyltransferase [Rhodobiaceae bacterium]
MTVPGAIRHLQTGDLPALNDIYNHYILTSPVTFDIAPKTIDEREAWARQFETTGRHQCFVALEEEALLGWACSGPFRPKAAYETSVEVSIYLGPQAGGRGLGSILYERLFAALEGENVHRALAGITVPNPASLALHRRFGFIDVGTYSEVGQKFDHYWDVLWMEKRL